ncbi:unnamed protein product, partial [Symbiodinium pilosum]
EDVGSGGVRGVRADPGDGSHFPLQSSEIHGALHRHRHEPLLATNGAAHVLLRVLGLYCTKALHGRRQVLQHE